MNYLMSVATTPSFKFSAMIVHSRDGVLCDEGLMYTNKQASMQNAISRAIDRTHPD